MWWAWPLANSLGRLSFQLCGLLLVASCEVPTAGSAPSAVQEFDLSLPPNYESWRPVLAADWQRIQNRFDAVAARWKKVDLGSPSSVRIVVPADSQAAVRFYQQGQLSGDPIVARTFPEIALAVVPLPRDDKLLQGWGQPPQTWQHSFRHECAHLLSLSYPELRAAPKWFQEGFAELWCADDAGKDGVLSALPETWPFWGTVYRWWPKVQEQAVRLPGEILYSYYAAKVARALAANPGPQPWLDMGEMQPPPVEGEFHGLFGRHAGWNLAQGDFLLVSRPQQQVDLDLPALWDGKQPLQLQVQVGRSLGQPEAALLFLAAGQSAGPRLRLRFGWGGGFTAYVEQGEQGSFQSYVVPNRAQGFAVTRAVSLEHVDDQIWVRSPGFSRSFALSSTTLQFPLRLRMVIRDGALTLHLP